MAYCTYIIALVGYYCCHSLMAYTSVKKWITFHLSLGGHYRIFYNLIAILTLFPAIYLYISTEKEIYSDHPIVIFLGLVFLGAGIYLFGKSYSLYSWLEFAGIRQEAKTNLVTSGLLRWVRHPLYVSGATLLLGFCLIQFNLWSLSTLVITLLYVYIGIRLEEAKLVEQFGEQYRNFQKEVPMFLPRLKRRE